jgi:hypothetical protein
MPMTAHAETGAGDHGSRHEATRSGCSSGIRASRPPPPVKVSQIQPLGLRIRPPEHLTGGSDRRRPLRKHASASACQPRKGSRWRTRGGE